MNSQPQHPSSSQAKAPPAPDQGADIPKRVFFLTRLRPGIDRAEYERFVREIDSRTAPNVLPITRYEVIRLEAGVASQSPAPYDYLEIVDVDDLDAFRAALAAPDDGVTALTEQAFTFLEESTVLDFYGEVVA